MSLILDALRKSEAERQRGQAPSLHSPAGRTRTPRRIWPLAGTVAAIALVGGTSWFMFRAGEQPAGAQDDAQAGANSATPTEAVAALVDASRTSEKSAATAGSLSTQPVLERESAPMMADGTALGNALAVNQSSSGSGGGEWPDPALNAPASGAAQPFNDQTVSLPPSMPVPGAPVFQTEPVAPAPAPSTPVAAAPPVVQQVEGLGDPAARPFMPSPAAADPQVAEPAAPTLPTIHELDFAIRRDLPKLNMSMLVYAKDPQRRFALVNGKRYVPGGEAIDGKVLVVDVVPDGLVCEINGQRFLLPRQ